MKFSFAKTWKKIIVGFGMLTLIAFLTGIAVYAAGNNHEGETLYALSVTSGVENGEAISVISVTYKSNGKSYTKIILPHEGDYQNSLKLAAEAGVQSTDTTMLEKNGYTLKGYQDNEPLQPNSTDTYLFYLPRKIDSVEMVSFCTDVGSTKGGGVSWTCKGLNICSVTKLNGLHSNGGYNNNYYIDFEGIFVTQMKNTGKSDLKVVSQGKGDSVLAIYDENNQKKSSAYLEQLSSKNQQFTGNVTTVYVEFDIADVLGAGIENFVLPKDQSNYYLPELLCLRYYYKDIYGSAKCVSVPVMSSALSFAYEQKVLKKTDSLLEYFAQGDSILLKLEIYQYGSVYEDGDNIGFVYDPEVVLDECGLVEQEVAKTCHNQIIENIKKYKDSGDTNDKNGDSLYITGVSVYYELKDENVGLKLENGNKVTFSVNDLPSYNYSAMSYKGDEIAFSEKQSEIKYKVTKFDGSKSARPFDSTQKFVLVLHTSPFSLAGTTDQISVKLGYTTKKNGETIYTDTLSLGTLVQDYYGQWLDKNGEEIGGTISTRAGGYIYGLLSMNNVYEFKSIAFTLTGSDSWQCQDCYIYQVGKSALKGRSGIWLTTNLENGTVSTDRLYYRPFNQAMLGLSSEGYTTVTTKDSSITDEQDFMVAGIGGIKAVVSCQKANIYLDSRENNKTLDFSTGTQTVSENVEEEDWRETGLINEMPYSETQKDLGFTEKVCEYTVNVKVGTEDYSNTTNGDPGSSNYFYFQLVFQNGKSSFVQANQQLAADAFIAGEIASFVISTNYYYGEVEAINIIPDDSSSLASPYDKLKIDYIEVVMDQGGNSSLTWKSVTNDLNKWVGIDYVEESEAANETNQKSRDLSDYLRTYKITTRNTNSEVLVAFQTAPGNGQLVAGSMQATFHVTKLDGTETTIVKDMISEMYKFMGSTAQTTTDPNHMLKPSQTNFFTMVISDVASFDSVDIAVTNSKEQEAVWEIDDFSISLIRENYGHKLSELAGGEILLDGKVDIITTATKSSLEQAKRTVAPGSNTTSYSIAFEENEFSIEEADTEAFFVTRVPESLNDYFNVYVYIKDDGKTSAEAEINARINYGNVYGDYQCSTPIFNKTQLNGQTVFYCNGLGVRGFKELCSVSLSTQSKSIDAYIEKVVIQQVREQVIIDTFVISCMGVNVKEKQIFYASASTSVLGKSDEYEEVYIQLGPETTGANLEKETNDVAVALLYQLPAGASTVNYQTPYVYLTDQEVETIGPNRVLKIRMKQTSMKEITGIVIAATGNKISLDVESVAVGWYDSNPQAVINENRMSDEDKGFECKAWYSTYIKETIKAGQKAYQFSGNQLGDVAKAIVPIAIYMDTMKDKTQTVGITGDGKIDMMVGYTKSDGKQEYRIFENILDYCEDLKNTSFKSGASDVMYFMAADMTNITYMAFHPYDDDKDYIQQWGLGGLCFSYGDGVDVLDQSYEELNRIGKEDNLILKDIPGILVGLKDVSMEVQITGGGLGDDVITLKSEEIAEANDLQAVYLYKGQNKITISGFVTGSGLGIDGIATKQIQEDSDWMLAETNTDKTVYTFSPEAASLAEETYLLSMYSLENPEVQVSFYVIVSPLEDPNAPTTAETTTAESTTAETTMAESTTAETTTAETTTAETTPSKKMINVSFSKAMNVMSGVYSLNMTCSGGFSSIARSNYKKIQVKYTVYNPATGVDSGRQLTTTVAQGGRANVYMFALDSKQLGWASLKSIGFRIDEVSFTDNALNEQYQFSISNDTLTIEK